MICSIQCSASSMGKVFATFTCFHLYCRHLCPHYLIAMGFTLLGTDAVVSISKISPYRTAVCGTQLIKLRVVQIKL